MLEEVVLTATAPRSRVKCNGLAHFLRNVSIKDKIKRKFLVALENENAHS